MKFEEFMKTVSERAGLDREQAEKAVRATLNTLAQRLAGGEAKDLASQLPEELKETVLFTTGAGEGHRMHLEEFIARIADREGTSVDAARRHAKAVMATLHDAVTDEEFEEVAGQLGPEYRELVTA
jgi:uncharacterized protein (DUF2267 family)